MNVIGNPDHYVGIARENRANSDKELLLRLQVLEATLLGDAQGLRSALVFQARQRIQQLLATSELAK